MIKKLLKIVYRIFILYLMFKTPSWHLGIGWSIGLEFLLLCLLSASFPNQTQTSTAATVFHKSVDDMTGLEFEGYCAELLLHYNFRKVTLTPSSNDYGADIIAYDKQGRKWVFQCKRFKSKVSNKAVQEVVAAKAHYKAECSAVMTNSELTKGARLLAKENGVALYEKIR